MLKQLSIYAENKKGVMQNITGILKNEDINILGVRNRANGSF